jgi:hypothetical protein
LSDAAQLTLGGEAPVAGFITTQCPACRRALQTPEEIIGAEVLCPMCRTAFIAEPFQVRFSPPPAFGGNSAARPQSVPRAANRTPRQLRAEKFGQDADANPDDGRYLLFTVRDSLSAPARGLMVIGALYLIVGLLSLVFLSAQMLSDGLWPRRDLMYAPTADEEAFFGFASIVSAITLTSGLIMVFGGYRMKSCRNRPWAIVASLLAIFPGGCCIFGLPLGIWSLVMLSNSNVKRAFSIASR